MERLAFASASMQEWLAAQVGLLISYVRAVKYLH